MKDGQLEQHEYEYYALAVIRGVRLLDALIPEWWWKINLATLELDEPAYCIIGQLGGQDYSGMLTRLTKMVRESGKTGLAHFHYERIDARFYGFDVSSEHLFNSAAPAWSCLTELWTRQIQNKRRHVVE